ncbi:MAG: TMEM165/GDT1 family protein [Epulopiscium sp.]|nr:TMEM165/GDT1 family protein [Candidatus Epulonipiscium sp.]
MLREYLQALLFIFIAEMGDKTQILAMMFATKYKMSQVLLGVLIGSFLNHGVAVLFGSLIGGMIPANVLQIIAGSAFIFFALWSLKEDDDEDEEEGVRKLGPVFTVAAAFFIGELGDKTQLTAITLSVDAAHPFVILLGTVSGMLLTSGVGIIVGSKIGDKIPELFMKFIAYGLFLVFGSMKLYTSLPEHYINIFSVSGFIVFIVICSAFLIKPIIDKKKKGEKSSYQKAAMTLHDYMNQMKSNFDNICLGENKCGHCEGQNCLVGYTKDMIKEGIEQGTITNPIETDSREVWAKKAFDHAKIVDSLKFTLKYLMDNYQDLQKRDMSNAIRNSLEMALFEETLEFHGDINMYLEHIKEKNPFIMEELRKSL